MTARRTKALILLAFAGVAVALRIPFFTESLWLDEIYLTNERVGSWPRLLSTVYRDTHPPLYFGFMHGWNAVFGDSEISVRMPALLFGLASIYATYRLGTLLFTSAVGTAAACFLVLSPVHIEFSHEARPYAANMLFVLTGFISWIYFLNGQAHRRWWLAMTLSFFAAVWCHYYSAFFVVLLALLTWTDKKAPKRGVTASCVLIGLSVAAWIGLRLYMGRFETGRDHLGAFGPREAAHFFLEWLPFGEFHLPPYPWDLSLLSTTAALGGIGLLFLALIVGLLQSLRAHPKRRGHASMPRWTLLGMLLTLPLVLMLLNLCGLGKTYIPRAMLTLLPFYGIAVARGLLGHHQRPGTLRLAFTFIAGGVMFVALFWHFSEGDSWRNPDWKNAAKFLIEDTAKTNQRELLVVATPWYQSLPYYEPKIDEISDGKDEQERYQAIIDTLRRRAGDDGAWTGSAIDRIQADFDELMRTTRYRNSLVRLVVRRSEGQTPDSILEWARSKGIRTNRIRVLAWSWQENEDHEFLRAIVRYPRADLKRSTSYYKLRIDEYSIAPD